MPAHQSHAFDAHLDPDPAALAAWHAELYAARRSPWLASLAMARLGGAWSRLSEWAAGFAALPRRLRRRLARARSAALPTAVLVLALAAGGASAGQDATITVDAPAGAFDGVTIAPDGRCALREALVNANDDAATHPDCSAGAGADTINLPAGVTLTVPYADNFSFGGTGLPTVSSTVVIAGNGATVRRDPMNPVSFRLFLVREGDLTLRDTRVTGGLATSDGGAILVDHPSGGAPGRGLTIERSTISGNTAGAAGGAIALPEHNQTLTISNSTISDNVAGGGGGISSSSGVVITGSTISGNVAGDDGGGITSSGAVEVTHSIISGNTAGGSGGGLRVNDRVVIADSTIRDNTSGDDGGGMHVYDGVVITNSTLSGNSAGGDGGGLKVHRGEVVIADSTFSGNVAGNDGGGAKIYESAVITGTTISGNSAHDDGGGLKNYRGVVVIANSTISRNSAGNDGGGAKIYDSAVITNSTITGNSAGDEGGGVKTYGSIQVRNTIIAGQVGGSSLDCKGFVRSLGNNIGGSSCPFTAAGDLHNVSPAALDLGPLQDNGGPTLTHLPGLQSVARDAGDNAACAAALLNNLDQRGAARPFPIGGTCDIGAVEAGAAVLPTSTVSPRPTASHTATPTASPQPPTASPQPPTASPQPPTATPPPPSATPAAPVCPQIIGRVPRAAIDTALADPGRVYGYGLLLDPSKPSGRFNPPRTWLSLHNLARPYHPLHNSVEFKAYCP